MRRAPRSARRRSCWTPWSGPTRSRSTWTAYDATTVEWIPSLDPGEGLLGHGCRWQMYDMNQGNPNVSLGYEFPVTIATALPANTADVDVMLDTGGVFTGHDVRPFADAEVPLAIEAPGTASTFTLS